MTLMILEILSLCVLISPIATTIWSSDRLVCTNFCCDCVTSSAAPREFSLFLRAMELISSLDAEVSSSDAACSDDPCASDWLEEETCPAAAATCSAPSESPPTAVTRVRLMVPREQPQRRSQNCPMQDEHETGTSFQCKMSMKMKEAR